MAVTYLLNCTARWTPQWFNKPKFHILLHLVEHIRQFGLALLFATETFESYNALIRSLSIHSNRQAPSRDIAQGFAHANCIRHLTSAGRFRLDLDYVRAQEQERKRIRKIRYKKSQQGGEDLLVEGGIEENGNGSGDDASYGLQAAKSRNIPSKDDFYLLGKEARAFIANDGLIKLTFRGPAIEKDSRQRCKLAFLTMLSQLYVTNIIWKAATGLRHDGRPVCAWKSTMSSKLLPPQVTGSAGLVSARYAGCKSCFLQNGDKCEIETFVIAKILAAGGLVVGRVIEILQISGSDSEMLQRPDLFLLMLYSADEISQSTTCLSSSFADNMCWLNTK